MSVVSLACLVILMCPRPGRAQTIHHGLRVPAGFEVTEFADAKLANDIYCMTIDPKGRVIVAGRGYIRILVDDDGDGKADRAIEFADSPKDGAMGLLWEGETFAGSGPSPPTPLPKGARGVLYVTGDGGLRKFTDRDGDGKADGPSTLIRTMKTGGEHTAHAIQRGPDGWLYVLCGNVTGIDKSYATSPRSPIREPVAGCVIRLSPDFKECEIVAQGFRNPYAMDFNLDGELFTFDSDNERCVSLPWYEPTRFYHVIPGGHYGWLSPQRASFWRMPPYFPDVVAPVATLGRGSPSGVVCYRHAQFPKEYRGGFFLADWTFGKIWFAALERKGASYTSTPRVFLEATGDNGFAPTALAAHPMTGDLFVSIGGRGTRGAVYRVRYAMGIEPNLETQAARQKMTTRSLAWRPELHEELEVQAKSDEVPARVQALQLALRFFGDFKSRQPVEAMILANWGHADRSVRKATADLLRECLVRIPEVSYRNWSDKVRNERELLTLSIAQTRRTDSKSDLSLPDLEPALAVGPKSALMDVIRLIQIKAGDCVAAKSRGSVFEGYVSRVASSRNDPTWERTLGLLQHHYPSGDAATDREILRTIAMLGAEASVDFLKRWTPESDPIDDIHELIVWARCTNFNRQIERVAAALLDLDRKIAKRRMNRDSNWPLRIGELYAALAEKDPDLHSVMVKHPDFGRPDHALFAQAKGFDRAKAAEIFLSQIQSDRNFFVTADVLRLFDALPASQVNPVVRPLWGHAGQDAAVAQLLARQPEVQDRAKFVQSLASPQPPVVAAALTALERLPAQKDGQEAFGLLRAWKQLPDQQKVLKAALRRRLNDITVSSADGDEKVWTTWLTRSYPDLATRLTNPDGVDVAAWEKRLARLDFTQGDSQRGQAVFVKANCAACHSGNSAIGPDLKGVTKRFSRPDLFTAIVQPSKDVPARYQTTQVETRDGKVYQGVVIYDAVDSLILQTGAAATIRLNGAEVVARQTVSRSLMPAGLLDGLTDAEIADLMEFLRR